jgi:superfamily II DNA or RNA helicase
LNLELIIDNSVCKVSGLGDKHSKALRQLLSYSIDRQAAYFSSAHNTRRYLIDKRGEFPTGLLYLVKDYLAKQGLTPRIDDRRKRPKAPVALFKMQMGFTPYPEQEEAARAAAQASRGIICAPTGVGKSAIVALIIDAIQVPTLVVVPSLELKRQLTGTLKACFGDLTHIRVENVDALDPAKPLKGYDCVIIDEFHHSGAKTYRDLNKKAWSGIYYKFGLTATPFRSQDHERLLLESVLSQVIYRIDHKTAVDKKYIVPIEAYYFDLPKREPRGNEYSWPSMYNELIVNNQYRNKVIANLIGSLTFSGVSTLCLVKEIKHGNNIQELCSNVDFANGLADNTRILILEFCLREKTCLIGTTGILGEGVDTKPAEYVIIAGLGKSKNAFMQACGRVFRTFTGKQSGKVILFRDASHKWTLQHFNSQVKYLRDEYGIKPVKLELPEGI